MALDPRRDLACPVRCHEKMISFGRCGRSAVNAAIAGEIPSALSGRYGARRRVPVGPRVVTATQVLPLRTRPDGHPRRRPSRSCCNSANRRRPLGQRRGSGLRQFGQIPINPLSAQLATGLSLQFGHLPVVPSGHERTIGLQFGHLPDVPSGQNRTIALQSGHLPFVPAGHLRDPCRCNSAIFPSCRSDKSWRRRQLEGSAAGLALW